MENKYYNRELSTILKEHNVQENQGLSTKEAKQRLSLYGFNLFTKVKEKSLLQEIKETLTEQLMIILMIAAGISVLIKEYHDAIGICFAVLLSTTIGILTESRSKKAAEALNRMTEDIQVKVLRDGEKILLPKSEIVPGDIVFLEAGDQVPADGRLISCLDLKVREDMLTGESDDVKKQLGIVKEEVVVFEGKKVLQDPIPAKQFNMLFGGTLIASGQAKMIVTTTGDHTEMGYIAQALGETEEVTPLELKMDQLAQTISKVSTAVAGMLFVYMLMQIIKECHLILDFSSTHAFLTSLGPLVGAFPSIKTAFVVCVALIVAAVPEGLPTMINITLAITMKQMAKINVLVRKKEACETIGSVSVICSDKTGTLTQNKMKVQKAYLEGHYIREKELGEYDHFVRNCMLNSTADLERHKGEMKYIGSATECALLLLCQSFDYRHLRSQAEVIKQVPFSSQNKYMLTIVKEDTGHYIYSKGAPEIILKQCTYEKIDGKIVKITPNRLTTLLSEISSLQSQSMRVLAFAYKSTSPNLVIGQKEQWAEDLIFQGFVGICDPLREGVKESIEIAAQAGIETKMLTGDNLQTAVAIGKEIGLVGHGKRAVEASYIDTLSDKELEREIAQIAIVARSKPDTKMRIVSALQKNGEVVAVTGDGINDAPALNKADVGIAMGIAGTEVSKNAADIILTDDSFSTIVEAIKWGRGIYNNFQRFIQFQLTVNIIAFLIAIISQVMGYDMPFTTIHLLWINIIMDGPPALALGLEPIRSTVMKRMPIKREAPIINRYMVRTILMNSTFITLLLFVQIKWNFLGAGMKEIGHASEVQTVLFSMFAFSVLFNALNCREFGTGSIFPNLFKNKLALEIIGLTAVLQIAMIQYAGGFFNAMPLSLEMWIKIIACGASVVMINEVVKELMRLLKRSAKTAVRKVRTVGDMRRGSYK
ncbi:MAG: calcium-translocating P-type ATPase, PMCA-type [Candidatus Cellulosilyticum pullistercoris]|uniref:P-type Ca(2+) transporter n=1 Tax=Candidatus Cellulosilyticum pullistercoris TaxID=2838521 RepID=A0A9E2KAN2_9FIRM|nr:calcium-translocating P-type ATPase, PMCA-type [Candidatus Cellulosilyticum pullistercoris]